MGLITRVARDESLRAQEAAEILLREGLFYEAKNMLRTCLAFLVLVGVLSDRV